MDERQLWLRFIDGDDKAGEQIFRCYADALFAYGMRMCRQREEVKDAIQDLFLKMLHRRQSLAPVDSVRAYLYVAFRRILVASWSGRHDSTISIDANERVAFFVEAMSCEDPSSAHADDDLSLIHDKALTQAIASLTERQKEAIYLYYIHNIDMQDIAHIMEMNYQSVRNLLHRAMVKLRQSLRGI